MTQISGSLVCVTEKPASISEVWVRAPQLRTTSNAVVTTEPDRYTVTDGQVSFPCAPGPAVLVLISGGMPVATVPIVVAAAESMTLQDAVVAAGLVDTSTRSHLEQLAAEVVIDARAELEAAKQAQLDQVNTAVDARIGEVKWYKGILISSVPLVSLSPGRYGIASKAVAEGMGLPNPQGGVLTVEYLDSPGTLYGRFTWEVDPSLGKYEKWRTTSYNGNVKVWYRQGEPYTRKLPDGAEIIDLDPGRYSVSVAQSESLALPVTGMGTLTVDYLDSAAYKRVEWITGTYTVYHYRVPIYNNIFDGKGWVKLHPVDVPATGGSIDPVKAAVNALALSTDTTTDYLQRAPELLADMKSRLGEVHTGGVGAVALMCDHGTTAFKAWVWAELKARSIPFTMALAPELHLDPANQDANHKATVNDVKQWVSEGLCIASHSSDHKGATGWVDIYRQIVGSKTTLESQLGTKVDAWIQPGIDQTTGNYDGYGVGAYQSQFTDTVAGRLLQKTYPVISAMLGTELVYQLSATPVLGFRRSILERKPDIDNVKALIQRAVDENGKHCTFIHPYAITGGDTYVSKEEYLAFLDWVVSLRDSGQLKLYTVPQLAIAEP